MTKRNKTILQLAIMAMILLAGLLTITGCDPSEPRAVRERIAINANADSYVRNGHDFYFYSDDRSTQKIQLEGSAGNIDAEGTLDVEGIVTFADDLSVGGTLTVTTLATETTDLVLTGDLTVADVATIEGLEAAYITATVSITGLDISTGDDMTVFDTLDVNGDFDLDGDGFDVDITAGASIDTDGAINVSASTGDILIDGEAGSVTIIGSEAAADSVSIDANDTVTSGLTIVVGSVSGMSIDGGLLDIGGGSYTTADADNDVGIAGDLEVAGTFVEVGKMAGVYYSIAAESANDLITVTMQISDANGTALATTAGAMWYLSQDAAGAAIADGAPSAGIAIVTDGLLIEWTADLSGLVICESDGDIDVVLGDNGADTFYFVIVMPDGTLDVSAIIEFAA